MEGRLANPGIQVKTPTEVEGMRVAGRLAAEVLDFITPHVKPNVTTGQSESSPKSA
jgi:methionyl aminopeptidase